MTDANARVQALIDGMTASGEEVGLQVAAYHHGQLVVDAWSGVADPASGRPLQGDSLINSFSTTKGVVATAIHILAERSVLEYDAPVATYWPEFAQNGKAGATLRHVLCHQEGVPQMPDGITPEMLGDWDGMCARIAALAPLWPPGAKTGYHAYTFGWILGEIVRRAAGRPIEKFIAEEVTGPLGIADFYLGMPDTVEPRVATLVTAPNPPGMPAIPPDALFFRAMPLAVFPNARVYNRRDVRKAVIPAGGGLMSARGIARHYAALAEGGSLNGVRVLSTERLALATRLQTEARDEVLGFPLRKSLGWFLGGPLSPMSERLTAFGHPGAGGSIGFADPEQHLAVGITKNLLKNHANHEEDTALRIAREVRAALGIPEGARLPTALVPTASVLMRRYYAALDLPNLDLLDDLFAPEIEWWFPGQTLTSGAKVKRSMTRSLATGLRMDHRIGHMLEQGNVAICELVATNTLPGGAYVVRGAVICEAEDGKIRRLVAYPDATEMAAFLAALRG